MMLEARVYTILLLRRTFLREKRFLPCMMGNTQPNRYEAASEKIALEFAGYEQEEKRLYEALKAATAATLSDGGGTDDGECQRKRLAKDLVRVRYKIKAVSKALDSKSIELKEEEKRLVVAILEANRQGRTSDADSKGRDLLLARRNIRDFQVAFEELQAALHSHESPHAKASMQGFVLGRVLETFKRAIEFDQKGEYEKALSLYRDGLSQNLEENLKDDSRKRSVVERLEVYAKRADELQNYLYKQGQQEVTEKTDECQIEGTTKGDED